MFKWKVSGLGGKKDKSKSQQQQRLNNEPQQAAEVVEVKNNNNNKTKDSGKKEKSKDGDTAVTQSPKGRGFRLFQSGGGGVANGGATVDTGTGTLSKDAIMSRVGQRLAMSPPTTRSQQPLQPPVQQRPQMGFRLSSENLLETGEHSMPPPLPPLKPEWRHHMAMASNTSGEVEEEEDDTEAIPSDSLYGTQETVVSAQGSQAWRQRSRPSLNDMAHWSSHGYLARDSGGDQDQARDQGYVLLKRQGDTMVTARSPQQQPSSLPPVTTSTLPSSVHHQHGDNKYFSVRGYKDFTNKVQEKYGGTSGPLDTQDHSQKYFSVDAKFLHQQAASDMKLKLRENLKVSNSPAYSNNSSNTSKPDLPQYYQPPPPPHYPPYQRPPPPMRQGSDLTKPPAKQGNLEGGRNWLTKPASNLESSRAMAGSVSWLEWTQQLQAYIAWVNSQLRKRPGLGPVQDLRTDLQSGETLAQLIEIISGEKIAGIIQQPESLQGMRENLDRVLQFMASKKVRMHQISSREILEGNLKAVMRLILALAAHYKPASVKHHDVSSDNVPDMDKTPGAAEHQAPVDRQAQDNDAKEDPRRPEPPVKRSPSLNESHYSGSKARLGTDPAEVFSQLERRQRLEVTGRPSVETQTPASAASRSLNVTPPVTSSRGQEPGSFTRTGSGRKLPQIPDRSRSNTLPTRREEPEKEVMEETVKEIEEEESQAKPSKPKAMEFWESMENIERNDFRYNTIHRMSMGRRLLPMPPSEAGGTASPHHHTRSQSVDRSEAVSGEAEKLSLNSSFSGPTSLPQLQKSSDNESSSASVSPRSFHKIPADGASLQSQNSEEVSLDMRREAEGSSNNNSPPTSVIQGVECGDPQSVWELSNKNPAYDWIRGSFDRSSDNGRQRQKWGGGHHGQEFNISDDLLRKLSASKDPKDKTIIPYDVLLEDLSQAKRQLLELHNLLANNVMTSSSSPKTALESLGSLNTARADLRRVKQECVNLEGSKLGLQTRLAEQEANISSLKQTLLRVTLAKQGLESEKKELARRLEEVSQEQEADRRQQVSQGELEGGRNKGGLYAEELRVARDAISNLRGSFSDADPGQHILDTLEQCISVIVERMAGESSKPGSRLSGRESEQEEQGPSSVTTKIVYFTPRSVTPFMTSISRPVGRITLRDFKALFDRPGFYRYHFKTMDKEFGMVKEEIAEDDKILPGVEGKIVVWVEEE